MLNTCTVKVNAYAEGIKLHLGLADMLSNPIIVVIAVDSTYSLCGM